MKEEKDIEFCTGGGCTAKLGAGSLRKVLSKLPKKRDDALLVGFDSSDDAAVYQVAEDLAIVQTLDFFPPMVDDPYTFGKIAAANALSDVYAMGGEVKTALNIVCFPEKWDLNILGKIMQGGSEKVMEAGGMLVGGHSILDTSVKYGLSVMGTVHPEKIWCNNKLREGDKLILTKPLGVGIICTAHRIKMASASAMEKAVASMSTLNKYAADRIRSYDISACTDVTGFGFLGHLSEMLQQVLTAQIKKDSIPYIEEAYSYAGQFMITAAAQRNRNFVGDMADFSDVSFEMQEILFDPQTSGGLLFGINAKEANDCLKELQSLNLPCAMLGEVVARKEKSIYIS